MNEFEWRRQMRDMRQPLAPPGDLWAAIDGALDGQQQAPVPAPARARMRWLPGVGLAAAAVLALGLGWHAQRTPAPAPATAATHAGVQHWKPHDPRLAGAAIELDAARAELRLAIQQEPDSPALQRLLDRTEQQQLQLRQRTRQAG